MFSQNNDYPADRLLSTPQFHNVPPYVPQLNIPRDYVEFIPQISLRLANEVSGKADKTNIRAYCYNLLSQNNFSNKDFVDLIQLGMSILIIIGETGRTNDINQALTEATTKAYNIFASKVAYDNTNLHQYLTNQDQEQEIMRNLEEARMIEGTLDRVLNSVGNQSNNYPVRDNYSNRPIQQAPSRFGVQQNRNTNIRSFGNGNAFGSNFSMTDTTERTFGRAKTTNSNESQIMGSNTIPVDKNIRSNFMTTQSDKGGMNMNHSKPVNSDNVILQGTDMKGESLQYFGLTLSLDNVINKAVITLDNISKPDKEDEEDILSFLSSTTLDDLLLTTRVKHMELLDSNPAIKLFRSYGFLTEPIINKSKISIAISNILGYSEDVTSFNNFINVSNKLRELLKETNNKKNMNSDLDNTELIETIRTICTINNKFTSLINEFLTECIPGTAQIDSFLDDIIDLEKLIDKANVSVGLVWESFRRHVIDSISYKLTQETYDDIFNNMNIDGNKFDISLFTKIVTITSVNIDNVEFGCEVKDKTLVIDRALTPNIWNIVDSVFKMKDKEKMYSIVDYIILADGTNFQIFKDSKNSVYKIKKIR